MIGGFRPLGFLIDEDHEEEVGLFEQNGQGLYVTSSGAPAPGEIYPRRQPLVGEGYCQFCHRIVGTTRNGRKLVLGFHRRHKGQTAESMSLVQIDCEGIGEAPTPAPKEGS